MENITREFHSREAFDAVIKSSVSSENLHNKYALVVPRPNSHA